MNSAQKLVFLNAAREHLRLPDIAHPKHYAVLNELLFFCRSYDPAVCFPSRNTLVKRTHYGLTVVAEVLSDLKVWGVLSTQRRDRNSNIYRIHWDLLEGADLVKQAVFAVPTTDEVVSTHPDDTMSADEPKVVSALMNKVVSGTEVEVVSTHPDTKSLKIKAEEIHTGEGMKHGTVMHIWESWNKAMLSIGHKPTAIPSMLVNGCIPNNPGAIYRAIEEWVANNSDAEERWQLVLDEIPANKWFEGFTKTDGSFWHPTLRDMFVPRPSFQKGRGFVGTPPEIGVERVLSGEFDKMRKQVKVNTTPLAAMQGKSSDLNGFESY